MEKLGRNRWIANSDGLVFQPIGALANIPSLMLETTIIELIKQNRVIVVIIKDSKLLILN